MADKDLCYLTATEAIAKFKRKTLSPVELMKAVIARCEAVNPTVNALTYTFFDRALAQARAAERRYARGANETTVDIMPETFDGDETKSEQEIYDDQETLRKAMATLPQGQCEAIELIKIQGLSLNEAAKVTGKSVGSLKVGIHRAIKAMRLALERKS